MHFFAASLEEAWSHISTVDLDESLRTVPMVAQSSPQKMLGTILNPTSSTSSKTTVPSLVDTDTDKSTGQVNTGKLCRYKEIIQTALLQRLTQDVHLLLLKVDMLEKMLRSKSGIDRSPNDDTKSLACLPFMAPYRTLTDFDTGEVILMSEEKRKTAVLSYLYITYDFHRCAFFPDTQEPLWGVCFERFVNVCSLTISPKSSAGRINVTEAGK
ncbi:hypothetical protein AHF37_00228 [Paragonimus kellicotti]|nr:hypothetical protein AHF37_00228 [Paragonimus kellicotti]